MNSKLHAPTNDVQVIGRAMPIGTASLYSELMQCRVMLAAVQFAIAEHHLTAEQKKTIILDIQNRLLESETVLNRFEASIQ